MRGHAAVLAVAAAARAQQQHRDQTDPAAHRVHDHGAGEIVELLAERGLEPGLHAEMLVPGDALEKRVDEADQQEGGGELRIEPARSAMPPETIAGTAAAKVSRKKNLTSSKPFFCASVSAPVRKSTP